MSASPITTAIAFAPADPRRNASQSSPSATSTAAYGARLRDVTRRGFSRVNGGRGGAGSVENVMSIAGKLTAPAPNRSLVHRATCTAQSILPGSPYSRVPSSGSTIQTRSAPKRRGSSLPSSESTASSGRCLANSDARNSCAIASPASLTSHVDAPAPNISSRSSSSLWPVSMASRVASCASDSAADIGSVCQHVTRVVGPDQLSFLYLMRCGCSAAAPSSFLR